MDRFWTTTLVLLTVATTVGLTGCAAMRRSQALDTEQYLAAAGFKMQLADTAAQRQLATMLPYRLASRTTAGAVEYTYADPKTCKCVYVGGPTEYSEYQRLVRERQLAQEQFWAVQDPWSEWGWASGRPRW
jgi:hypothetical protein